MLFLLLSSHKINRSFTRVGMSEIISQRNKVMCFVYSNDIYIYIYECSFPKFYFLSEIITPASRQTCLFFERLLEPLVAEALELAWSDNKLRSTGVVKPTMLTGGSSCDEKSELSNVDRDIHSSK